MFGQLLSGHGVKFVAIGFATQFMGVVGVLAVRGLVPAAVPVFYGHTISPLRAWRVRVRRVRDDFDGLRGSK